MSRDRPIRRVLQVRVRYRKAGGEDQVVEAEKELLDGPGSSVRHMIFDNADLRESLSLRATSGSRLPRSGRVARSIVYRPSAR